MKIFATISVASILALTSADIRLEQGYSYNGNSVPQMYYMQQQQPLQQYQQNNLIPTSLPSTPNLQYFETQQQQHNQVYIAPVQHQQQQQQKQSFAMTLPMPADFPASFNYQPAVNTKSNRRYRPRSRIPKKTIVTKNFFIHSAPEESQDEIDEELAELQQQPRKHYNVLFLKTPTQTNKAAALNLAKAIKEEKTVVYVLAKKTSATDLQDAIQQAPQFINKPEVFFIKYRTPEEAANAQRQIQAQYDSLGGSTTITDEGVAPATSVIGSLDASEDDEEETEQQQHQVEQTAVYDQQQQQQHQHNQQPQYDEQQLVNGYLPPSSQY